LPIVRKLVKRGHEVVWITGRRYQEKVEGAGAIFYPIPKERDPNKMEIYDFYPKLKERKGLFQINYWIKHIFLDACSREIKVINAVLKDFPADILVGDTVSFSLYFISEMKGLPFAQISLLPLGLLSRDTAPFGLGLLPGKSLIERIRNRLLNFLTRHILFRSVTKYANNTRRKFGLEPLDGPFLGAMFEKNLLTMHASTPAFEYPRSDQPETVHFIGPILPEPDHTFQPPYWWSDLNSAETVVLVNQGTIATDPEDLIVPTIKGLRDQQILVIAVPVKEGQLGELTDHVRSEPFIPFGNLLPHVNVMVTNGGYGGTQLALAHGIPLVVAGETEDKMEVAARIEWAGVGINLRKHRPSHSEIREAVKEVLANPIYRHNAKRIQANFAQYDAPTRAAELLEVLVSGLFSQ
jgi:MGT family glycosyltransferase